MKHHNPSARRDPFFGTVSEPSQCEKILAVLRRRRRRWVPMPQLARAARAYAVHSRISDLREAGWRIECRVRGARPRQSAYRLLSGPAKKGDTVPQTDPLTDATTHTPTRDGDAPVEASGARSATGPVSTVDGARPEITRRATLSRKARRER